MAIARTSEPSGRTWVSPVSWLLAVLVLLIPALSSARGAEPESLEMGSPAHQAQAALLSELLTGRPGAITIPTGACSNAISGARTVAQDMVFYLAALSRDGRVSAACEKTTPGQEACRVTVAQSIPGTEIRWSRFYRFTRSSDGRIDGATLECLTVP